VRGSQTISKDPRGHIFRGSVCQRERKDCVDELAECVCVCACVCVCFCVCVARISKDLKRSWRTSETLRAGRRKGMPLFICTRGAPHREAGKTLTSCLPPFKFELNSILNATCEDPLSCLPPFKFELSSILNATCEDLLATCEGLSRSSILRPQFIFCITCVCGSVLQCVAYSSCEDFS